MRLCAHWSDLIGVQLEDSASEPDYNLPETLDLPHSWFGCFVQVGNANLNLLLIYQSS